MIADSVSATLLCNTLDRILLVKELKLIGVKFINLLMFSLFRINTIVEYVPYLGISLSLTKLLTILHISSSIISRQFWKKKNHLIHKNCPSYFLILCWNVYSRNIIDHRVTFISISLYEFLFNNIYNLYPIFCVILIISP